MTMLALRRKLFALEREAREARAESSKRYGTNNEESIYFDGMQDAYGHILELTDPKKVAR